MRFYQMFKTMEDRKDWVKEMQSKHKDFKVCMYKPVNELAKEIYLPQEQRNTYKYAVIYMYWGEYA